MRKPTVASFTSAARAPITSKSHTHPSHSQTSRLLTSSLSLGVPVPRTTQCIRDVSNVVVNVIPSQDRITLQILNHWKNFRDLKLMFEGSCRAELGNLSSHQSIVDTVEPFVLRTEITGFESQEVNVPKRILFFKSMS